MSERIGHRMVLEVGEVGKVDESTHVLTVSKKGGIGMGELRERESWWLGFEHEERVVVAEIVVITRTVPILTYKSISIPCHVYSSVLSFDFRFLGPNVSSTVPKPILSSCPISLP
jgi:hypothetical protein